MKNKHNLFVSITPLCLAMATTTVNAGRYDLDSLTTLKSSIEVGVEQVSSDNERYGMYTDQNESGANLKLDVDVRQRDEETGTWLNIKGNNLGLDNRDLTFEHERQGEWGYSIGLDQMPMTNPFTITSGLIGEETDVQTLNGVAPRLLTLETHRDKVTISGMKHISKSMVFNINYQNEKKTGARQWGFRGGRDLYFAAEPLDSLTQQMDASISYSDKQLQLAAGYYGTHYSNDFDQLIIDPGTLDQSLSLPPDNWANQFFVSGGYNISPSTRSTFKLSHTKAKQEDEFFVPATLNTLTDLGGEVVTNLAQLGLSMRPLTDMTLRANFYYEDRDDRTANSVFLTESISSSRTRRSDYASTSRQTKKTSLEMDYRLPYAMRLSAGLELDERRYDVPTQPRSVSYRDETDDTTIRLALSKSLSATLNGSVALINSKRDGTDYLETGYTGFDEVIDPINWADRDRTQLQLTMNWMATDRLSLQMQYNESDDDYDGRALGPREGSSSLISIDGSYRLNDKWQLASWVTRNEYAIDQASHGSGIDWTGKSNNTTEAIGIGAVGDFVDKYKIGMDLQYSKDDAENQLLSLDPAVNLESLPDYYYKVLSLNAYMDYQLSENTKLRLDYTYEKRDTNDWTWQDWVYADGTTVSQDPNEDVYAIAFTIRTEF